MPVFVFIDLVLNVFVRLYKQGKLAFQRSGIFPIGFCLAGLAYLSSCTPSLPDGCFYGIEEFIEDSCRIQQGKLAILQMEEKDEGLEEGIMEVCEEQIIDGDVLTVAFFHPKRQDRVNALEAINQQMGFCVCEGCIRLPELDQVEVAGLTLQEAKEKIQGMCRAQMSDMQVFISYKKRRERRVEIVGAAKEHVIDVDGKMRLYEVLAKAQLTPKANLFKSYVLREDRLLPVDLYKLLNQGDMTQNIVMQGGDRIFIADRGDATVAMMGEVGRAELVALPYGFISLKEAIVSANGIPFTGDERCIQVIRGNLTHPKIYVLSWNCIRHIPNDQLLLMPGDTVYVSERPLTQWNRFISQLQPSMLGLQTGYGCYIIYSN
ncbi:polysaccharide biosynthesis/export family protein [Candidatus Protochlamydia phocaeensis]|uniref:polysaccharide biosynthesis/export family protein n=1 Tax=Candidatus Protochlamydia phocaeensis TaxID=1414722 RepID=UPI000B1F4C62|nr:polysaccharide biosynthesis/export family protein [Candidatus Protochlamydia phocaeensis]